MNFNPTAGYVLVGFPKEEPKNPNAIILNIDGGKKELPSHGTVLKLASEDTQTGYTVGDRVYFNKYAGIDLVLDDVKYSVLKHEDIFGYETSEI
jgi:co-chaperonin GroES (HSP10)